MTTEMPPENSSSAAPRAAADKQALLAERARLAAALERQALVGRLLDPWGPSASIKDSTMFVPNRGTVIHLPRRLRIHQEIAEAPEVSLSTSPSAGTVMFTAGAPGAGKSFRLEQLGWPGAGGRVIDPDRIKERLIAHLLKIDDPWLLRVLAALEKELGVRAAPLELAAIVHEESLMLAEISLREALRSYERVCFAGTCTNETFVRRLLQVVRDNGRDECRVLLVEVPETIALERAENRWWEGRDLYQRGLSPLGARFVPASVIRQSFNGGSSVASQTIRSILADQEEGITLVLQV